jgi:hypothetical protein
MALLMIMEVEGGTTAQYDRVDELLGVVTPENAPEGLISHTVAVTDTGLVVADVWESPEDMQRFFEAQLGAALQDAEVEPTSPPRVLPVHNHLHGSGREEAVLVLVEIDGMTTADYDVVAARMSALSGDGSGHPSVSHVAAVTDTGLVAFDVWGSEEEFAKFGKEELAPWVGDDKMAQLRPLFGRVHKRVAAKEPASR